MQIDWFTFGAQILNFLLLIWLLKRFLYGPIIQMMDRREEQIRTRIEEADRRHREAEAEADEFRRRREELESGQEKMMATARENAEQHRKELLREARRQVAEMEDRWRKGLDERRTAFIEELGRQTVSHTMDATRHVLRDLAGADLDDQLYGTFLERLKLLDEDERKKLAEGAGKNHRVRIVASFTLEDAQRHDLAGLVRSFAGSDVKIDFSTDNRLGFGIELNSGDRKLSWTADDYLGRFEASVGRVLEEEVRRRAKTEPGKSATDVSYEGAETRER